MSKGDTFANDVLRLIFNAVAIPDIADNAASSPLASLYVALHTADPGEAGAQSTSEISYTGYARVAVPRTTSGWIVTGNSVSPANNIDFGAMTAGAGGTATHFSIGVAATGATNILYSGAIIPPISATVGGLPPRLTQATTITED